MKYLTFTLCAFLALTLSARENFSRYAPPEAQAAVYLDLAAMRDLPAVQATIDDPNAESTFLLNLLSLLSSHYAGFAIEDVEHVEFLALPGARSVIVLSGDTLTKRNIDARLEHLSGIERATLPGSELAFLYTDATTQQQTAGALVEGGQLLVGGPASVRELLARFQAKTEHPRAGQLAELREGRPLAAAQLLSLSAAEAGMFGGMLDDALLTVTKGDDWLVRLRLTPTQIRDLDSITLLSQSALLLLRNHLEARGDASLANALVDTLFIGREGGSVLLESRLSTELIVQAVEGRTPR